ncbi:conserved exported hypothetical protein [Tenacibaculum sp. 190524A02b]|uniref:Uncharacterized protein n=1 Tax=Tenacibaculum vairaonense TaxID=3137860 RepID=A0ABM9PNC9_9FLAO
MKKIILLAGALFIATYSNVIAQDHSVSGDWEINVDNNNNDSKTDQFWVSYGKERKKMFEVNPEEIKANSKRFDFRANITDRFGDNFNSSIIIAPRVIQLSRGEGGSLSISHNGIKGISDDSFEFSLPPQNSNEDFNKNFRILKRNLNGRIKRKLIIDDKNTRVFNSLVVLTDVGENKDKIIFRAEENLVDVQAGLFKGKIIEGESLKGKIIEAESSLKAPKIVASDVIANKVTLNVGSFPDYVFANNYDLMPLEEVASFIKKHQHLPNMKSEKEVVKEGMELKELTLKLVEKVEELTLYTIQQQKLIDNLQAKLTTLKK